MDARSSFGSPFSNIQNKQNALNERLSTATPMQGWGAPAVGFSPYTCNFRPQRSPRDCNTSPIHGNYQQRSPRTQQNIFKHPSPNGPRTFRSPYNYLPFSPPGSEQKFRGTPNNRGRGRKSFNNFYGKVLTKSNCSEIITRQWLLVRVDLGLHVRNFRNNLKITISNGHRILIYRI